MTEDLTPEEKRQRTRQERDRQRAEIAFWDFYNMGPQRSLTGLFRHYVALAKDPKEAERVPSRSKSTLERWRKQYEWDARCAQEDSRRIESERRDFDQLRRHRLEDLIDLSVEAVKTLKTMLTHEEVPWREKRQAAETILDRVGISPRKATSDTPAKAPQNLPVPTPNEATEQDWMTYYEQLKAAQ